MAKSGLSDRIRLLVSECYAKPAMKFGNERLSIRVKDVLNDVVGDPDARGRTPAICEVLQGNKLLRESDLEIEGVESPPSRQSTTAVVYYRILHPGRWAGMSPVRKRSIPAAADARFIASVCLTASRADLRLRDRPAVA